MGSEESSKWVGSRKNRFSQKGSDEGSKSTTNAITMLLLLTITLTLLFLFALLAQADHSVCWWNGPGEDPEAAGYEHYCDGSITDESASTARYVCNFRIGIQKQVADYGKLGERQSTNRGHEPFLTLSSSLHTCSRQAQSNSNSAQPATTAATFSASPTAAAAPVGMPASVGRAAAIILRCALATVTRRRTRTREAAST